MIDQAMILAAGFGTRMRPLTETTPKPLLLFHGRPILDYAVEKLVQYGVTKIVINAYHLKEKIQIFIQEKKEQYSFVEFIFSDESEILETGGGVQKALPFFGNNPFFVINGDSFWIEKEDTIFAQLEESFRKTNETTLAVCELDKICCAVKRGDYFLKQNGLISRFLEEKDYAYMGIHVCQADVFKLAPKTSSYSLIKIWDQLDNTQQLRGIVFTGKWYHLSTPEDLNQAI